MGRQLGEEFVVGREKVDFVTRPSRSLSSPPPTPTPSSPLSSAPILALSLRFLPFAQLAQNTWLLPCM